MNNNDGNGYYQPPVGGGDNVQFDAQSFRVGPENNIKAAFSSGLYLAMCVLASIFALGGSVAKSYTTNSEGVQVLSGVRYNFNIIAVLIVIGMWITFAAAKNNGFMKFTGLRLASGALKAQCIIVWVLVGILACFGVILIAVGVACPSEVMRNYFDSLQGSVDISGYLAGYMNGIDLDAADILPVLLVGCGVGMIFAAGVMTLLDIFYFRTIWKFARSLCVSVQYEDGKIEHAKGAACWLLVMGILDCLSGVVLFSFAAAGGVVMILAYVLIKKYFYTSYDY